MQDSTKLALIRQYVKAGIYVYPVYVGRKPDGKKDVRPIGPWRKDSSISPADVEAWWGEEFGEHRDADVLIDTGRSGLVVVDCDGEEGIDNWAKLHPGSNVRSATLNGGIHHWFRAHPDHVIGNDQDGKIAPKVDVRGLGGLVIAPPSKGYEWIGEVNLEDLETVPQVVIDAFSKPAPSSSKVLVQGEVREFTKEQAEAFVKREYDKLKATTHGFNGAINNFSISCAHFPPRLDRERCARLMIKALGPTTGWTAPDKDDLKTIDSAYSATEAGRSWVAVENTKTQESLVSEAGTILPPPGQPLAVARALVERMEHTDGEIHRAWWRGDFYAWTGSHWQVEPLSSVERWLYQQTGDATYKHKVKDDFEDVAWSPNRKKIGDLVHALGVGTIQHMGDEDRVMSVANGVLEGRTLKPHRPSRFNLWSLPFAYDPSATCPAWEGFLESVLPGDQQAKDFLAEWFGYVISGRTDQQKMAALIGKRRSGKGTVARVLGAMVGKENVAGLDLNLVAGTFGMENLIGKALAISGDVRWHSRNVGDAVPVLLGVIGEDVVDVHRKNRSAWSGTLGVRFMLMSNDTPTFSDRSGALGGRMIYVRFDQSFYGREDTSLTDKLMAELPGILNWSLAGLDRLNGRGHFTEPASSHAEAEAVRRLSDPIGSFLEDWCEVGPEYSISLDHLFLKYRSWCESEGRTKDTTTKEIFSRDLRQKVEGLEVKRAREAGKQIRMLKGITSHAV